MIIIPNHTLSPWVKNQVFEIINSSIGGLQRVEDPSEPLFFYFISLWINSSWSGFPQKCTESFTALEQDSEEQSDQPKPNRCIHLQAANGSSHRWSYFALLLQAPGKSNRKHNLPIPAWLSNEFTVQLPFLSLLNIDIEIYKHFSERNSGKWLQKHVRF